MDDEIPIGEYDFEKFEDEARESIENMAMKYNMLKKDFVNFKKRIDVQIMQAKQIEYLRGDNMILQDENKNLVALLKEAEDRAELAESELRTLKYEVAGGMRK